MLNELRMIIKTLTYLDLSISCSFFPFPFFLSRLKDDHEGQNVQRDNFSIRFFESNVFHFLNDPILCFS